MRSFYVWEVHQGEQVPDLAYSCEADSSQRAAEMWASCSGLGYDVRSLWVKAFGRDEAVRFDVYGEMRMEYEARCLDDE
jgi:hypothetical protein